MSRAGWECQAVNSIESVLGYTGPKLASPGRLQPTGLERRDAGARKGAITAAPPAVPPPLAPAPRKAPYRGRGLHRAAIRYDPQDTQPSDIDLWQREIIVRGRAGKPGRPLSPRRAG
jgi:hypothetical protein